MSNLILHHLPHLRQPVLLVAFRGWPDAGEVASGAVRYLRRSLQARKFAEINSQPFYDFTRNRPTTHVAGPGLRSMSWPTCAFTSCQCEGERDLVLFLAEEPHLQWQTFADTMLELAERVGAGLLVSLGGTFDGVAHTRPAAVSGYATDGGLRKRLEQQGIPFTTYEGPTSIHSAVMYAATERGLPALSLWGHAPHYVTDVPNPKISHGLLAALARLLGFAWDLTELQQAGEALVGQVDKALEARPELKEYVQRLEESAGAEPTPEPPSTSPELPSPEAFVRDMEDYLRRLRQGEEGEQ